MIPALPYETHRAAAAESLGEDDLTPLLKNTTLFTMDRRLLIVALGFVFGATLSVSQDDPATQCKIKWLFGIGCGEVNEKLVSQIKAWQVQPYCRFTKEKCSYKLVTAAPYMVQANYTSPKTKKTNLLQFLLEQSTVCKMTGEAMYGTVKDQTDDGTNFCSLQNLINGSSLTDATGYKQFSNKWICPGFDTANCTLS